MIATMEPHQVLVGPHAPGHAFIHDPGSYVTLVAVISSFLGLRIAPGQFHPSGAA
jgi:hypothetical protein